MSPFHGTAFTNRVSNSFHFRIFLKFNKELGVLKRRAATRSDKHSFKEYCADNGLKDDKVLLWMRANNIKYGSMHAAQQELGTVKEIRATFIDFQQYLYEEAAA